MIISAARSLVWLGEALLLFGAVISVCPSSRSRVPQQSPCTVVKALAGGAHIAAGCIGRRNRYEVNPHLSVRHPVEQPHRVGELLAALASRDEESGTVRQTSVGRVREDLPVDGERRRSPSAD